MTDVALLLPELILVGMALALILAARRIQNANAAAAGTVLAAVAAAFVSIWLMSDLPKTGFGDMIILDGYSQFFKVLIASALALVALLSASRIGAEHVRPAEYHALLLLASTGMMFAVSANDLLTLYLGLELTTLCSYILVGITVERPKSNEAAIKYFLLGSFASALLLYGISLAYGVTGATNFAAIASAISARGLGSNHVLLAAVGLLTAGLAFKIAAVPFHSWAPDAYEGASAPVAAFLAAASKAAGLAALGRICLIAIPN
jgi:NADH-quinone oxidoreductase subunit N